MRHRRSGTAGNCSLRLGACVLLFAAIPAVCQENSPGTAPLSLDSLVALDSKDIVLAFGVEQATGRLFRAGFRIAAQGPGNALLGSFTVKYENLVPCLPERKFLAIAANDGELAAVPASGGLILKIDPLNCEKVTELAAPKLKNPTQIAWQPPLVAALQDGRVVVTNLESGVTVEIQPFSGRPPQFVAFLAPNQPAGTPTAPNTMTNLVVSDSKNILVYASEDLFRKEPDGQRSPPRLLHSGDVTSLSAKGSYVLFAGPDPGSAKASETPAGHPWIQSTDQDAEPIPLPYYKANVTLLSSSKTQIVYADNKNRRLTSGPSPVPLMVTLGPESLETNRNLGSLYRYLLAQGLLPTKNVTARLEQGCDILTLRHVLLENKVMIPDSSRPKSADCKSIVPVPPNGAPVPQSKPGGSSAAGPRRPPGPAAPPDPLAEVVTVICGLNSNDALCVSDTSPAILDRPIRPGTAVTVPAIPLEVADEVREVALSGRRAEDWLANTADRKAYDTWRITQLNLRRLPSFEANATLSGLLVATPWRTDPEFRVGSLVTLPAETPQPADSQPPCGDASALTLPETSVLLPSSLSLSAGGEAIPGGPQLVAALKNRNVSVSSIEIRPARLTEQIIDLKGRDSLISCLTKAPATSQVIVRTLSASSVRLRLRNDKNEMVELSPAELAFLGPRASADPNRDYSAVLTGPLILAYSAVKPPSLSADAVTRGRPDPHELKPNSIQDVLSIAAGTLLLPQPQWSAEIVVNQQDALSKDSKLKTSLDGGPGVRFYSRENLTLFAQNVHFDAPHSVADSMPLTAVTKGRTAVRNRTHFPDAATLSKIAGKTDAKIVMIEDLTSLGDHDDLCDAGPNGRVKIWQKGTDPPQPCEELPTAPAPADPPSGTEHHATHIAGLLAARGQTAPGLVPKGSLLVIDTNNFSDATLKLQMDKASKQGFLVFNISQTLDIDPKVSSSIRDQLLSSTSLWQDNLYIVAAGNNGVPVAAKPLPFIAWVKDVENMIGVGAALDNGEIAKDCPDIFPTKGCSNFGRDFVQLLAPGVNVYSTGKDNKYLVQSGSSEAVPQVAATAALLVNNHPSLSANQIKTRLIYTADPRDSYNQAPFPVWGGHLNAERALFFPDRIVYSNQTRKDVRYAIEFDPNAKIEFEKDTAKVYEPDRSTIDAPDSLLMSQVLRMQWDTTNSSHWIFYIDEKRSNRLRLIGGAHVISATMHCTKFLKYDPKSSDDPVKDDPFKISCDLIPNCKDDDPKINKLPRDIDPAKIFDYVAPPPKRASFYGQ